MATVQRTDPISTAPTPRPGPTPTLPAPPRPTLGVDRIEPAVSDHRGLILGAVVAGAIAVQFVPGLDLAVDAGAAATGGSAALEGATLAGAGAAARSAGAAVATGAAETALPFAKKIGAFFLEHGKSLARELAIGTIADAIIHPPGQKSDAGSAAAEAVEACASGHVKSAHIKDATSDVTIACK